MQLEVDCMYIFPLSLLFFVQSIDLTSSFIRFFVRHDAKKKQFCLLFNQTSSFVHSFIHSFIQHGSKELFFLSPLLPSAISHSKLTPSSPQNLSPNPESPYNNSSTPQSNAAAAAASAAAAAADDHVVEESTPSVDFSTPKSKPQYPISTPSNPRKTVHHLVDEFSRTPTLSRLLCERLQSEKVRRGWNWVLGGRCELWRRGGRGYLLLKDWWWWWFCSRQRALLLGGGIVMLLRSSGAMWRVRELLRFREAWFS